jgi:hypothetical protein
LVKIEATNVANAKEDAMVCQQKWRTILKQINERAWDVLHNTLELNPFELLTPRDVNKISLKIINILAKEFGQIAGHDNRQDILLKVLQHDTIITILP